MPVPINSGRIELPQRMRSRLDAFRRRLWIIKIGEGVLAGLFGLLLSYAVVFVLDRFGETPAMIRGGLLLAGTLGLGVGFPLILHRWVWGTRQLEQVARLVRRRYPRLGDQLLGIVELAQTERNDKVCSEDLLRAAVEQVDDEIASRDITDAAPNNRLRRWGLAAGVVTALAAAALLVTPAAGRNALARWLMPWRETERYTFAQLNELPNEMIVPYAEDFSLTATLRDGTEWKPDRGEARFGENESIGAELTKGVYDFKLPPQKDPDTLNVSIGDARKTIAVQPMPRPELTELLAHITLPKYLRYSHPLTQDIRGGTTSIVTGSQVHFEAKATRPLKTATMDGAPQRTEGSTIVTEQQVVTESSAPRLSWIDEVGLAGKRPVTITINAKEDAPPLLTCGGGALEQVVLEGEVIKLDIQAKDDFGVKLVGMVWAGIESPYRNPHPSVGEKELLNGDPEETTLAAASTFSAKREGIPPQSLRLKVYAVDYKPGRERVYSPEFVIHVLSPEEHNIWLTRQLSKWFRTAVEVHDKERQLHHENIALRALPLGELDRPENRRRLMKQAAGEKANSRRLGQVTDAGEKLIREALKNDEFNPQTLETWAEMLNALRDIADKRMPSVADLLADASKAKAGKKPGEASRTDAKQNPQAGDNKSDMAGKAGSPKTGKVPRVPQISDIESGFNEDKSKAGEPKPPSPAKSGKLTLPKTVLMGGGPPSEDKPKPPAAPAEKKVAEAIEEQQDLLDEFARVQEELQRILDNLEGSTFVKRFKAASRRQLEVAGDLNTTMIASFGVPSHKADAKTKKRANRLSDRERAQSDTLWYIQSDLKAYFDRVRDGKFKVVLDEMSEDNPVGGLSDVGRVIKFNRAGQAIASSEFWADTFDRWGEQLVGPACKCNGQCPPGKQDSLPPHIVLAVMRILEKEISLREETRATEQSREAIEANLYGQRADSLSETQDEISDLVLDAIEEIEELETAASFGRELNLLTRVEEVMREAAEILSQPETGGPAIAAETEAIELLLQAKRSNPNGGGGGGGSTPGGGGGGDTEESALALLGAGDEKQAQSKVRSSQQATGVTGRTVPAEFRSGLDAFFGALEGARELESE